MSEIRFLKNMMLISFLLGSFFMAFHLIIWVRFDIDLLIWIFSIILWCGTFFGFGIAWLIEYLEAKEE